MIQIQGISKFYKPDIVALKDVTFDIDTGEFMFLVGPSGAGKSTLIRLIIKQELPTQGTIVFDDTDVMKLEKSLLPYYRQQIGVVFQDYKLIRSKTVRENIEFALEITGKTDKEIRETTDSLLEVVALTERQHLFPDQLSGGEKQRAGIARALANDPKLLIADEPTGNLDPETSFEIADILESVNKWGTTILIATHDKELVDALNKRVVRLEDGEMICDHIGKYDNDKKPTKGQKKQSSKKKKESKSSMKENVEKAPEEPITADIDCLNLSKKTRNQLKKNNITSVDTLLDMSESDLAALKGIGEKGAQQIIASLKSIITAPEDNEKK